MKMIMKWTGILLLDLLLALLVLVIWLEINGSYFSIILQRPVNTEWFGILPENHNPAPTLVTRIRGPFPLPAGLADYGIISVAEGDVVLRGRLHAAAYQSLAFYPNTHFRLGSAPPSVLDFENIDADAEGNYVIHISAHKESYMQNWLDLQGDNGGLIALRSYRPKLGEELSYPSVEVAGELLQKEQSRVFYAVKTGR